ncbi:hypothetical protein [Collimonas sp.]|jgi:hypothetical protein|uniref:hypothetical protein n=1 Tax=Collimonas sp. TaxID=1963772 RepID=UPI002C64D418|nr:hypothetical protein [Collimonas sp.]HWX02034.1 hypothetical protein [Collimonas sp.]
MENTITLLWLGLGFTIADRVQVDQLNDCVFNEWLQIPLESRRNLALVVTDENDFSAAFAGATVGGFRFIFLQDYKIDPLVAFSGMSFNDLRAMPTCNHTNNSRGKLVHYARKYIYKAIFRQPKYIFEPAEAL